MIDLLEAAGFLLWSYARILRTGKYPSGGRAGAVEDLEKIPVQSRD